MQQCLIKQNECLQYIHGNTCWLPQSLWYTSNFSRATSTAVSSTASTTRCTADRPSAACPGKVTTAGVYRAELALRRTGKPRDIGETRDFAPKGKRREKKIFGGKRRPTERKVKRWRTEMKPSLSSLCQLVVSSVSEERDCWGEESAVGFFAQDCLKTATMQKGSDDRSVYCSAQSLTMAFVRDKCQQWDALVYDYQ